MNHTQPAVSVVLPVFNGGKYLHAAIESVLTQTFKDFELIVLNDGSTDSSLRVIQSFAFKDPRVVIVNRENRGLVATLNEGVQLAKADLVARMDADDICYPNRLTQQYEYIKAHVDCVAVGTLIQLIDPEGLRIKKMGSYINHDEIVADYMRGNCSFFHPTVMFRREVAVSLGGYSDQYRHAEDVDFFLRLAEVGRLANLPEVLLNYRQHSTSIGYAHSQAQMRSARSAVAEACRRRNLPSRIDFKLADASIAVQSKAAIHYKWAWWALVAGNVATARKHAWKAILEQPLSFANWKLALCVLRGY
ncbi:glycosyltransferase [Rhodoferax sp.]|uniref:glycosyltransferase n=1 Tax=Rhodoferax sp. TaxID=50421 RepID=UPI00263A142B|nr:glycosyltransferase [Rhodoferax sp.]MDD3936004.1 glycosyltransferase [Rhodoferax sp.]